MKKMSIQNLPSRELTPSEMRKPGRVLINRKQLRKIIPLCDRTIYNMEKRGEFPKRFTITARMVAWDLQEVEDWMEARKSAGGQATMPCSQN